MVVAKSHIQVDDEDEETAMEIETHQASTLLPGYKWLFEQLPALPQFKTVYREVCAILREVSGQSGRRESGKNVTDMHVRRVQS